LAVDALVIAAAPVVADQGGARIGAGHARPTHDARKGNAHGACSRSPTPVGRGDGPGRGVRQWRIGRSGNSGG
jgi:hypothetical protein